MIAVVHAMPPGRPHVCNQAVVAGKNEAVQQRIAGTPRKIGIARIKRHKICQPARGNCPRLATGCLRTARAGSVKQHATGGFFCGRQHGAALVAHGVELEPIPCGGSDSVSQQREQWTDGANAFALAPGVITLYDRNVATAETLAASGFRVIEAEDLLLGREELNPDDCGRVCVLVSSHEMSRARGGPHCLVHPLYREDL